MGKLEKLVDSPAGMEGFRAKYRIPPRVGLEYCSLEEVLTKRKTGTGVGRHSDDSLHRRRNDDPYGEDNQGLSAES